MFNKGKIEELTNEIGKLNSQITELSKFGGMNAVQIEQEITQLRITKTEIEKELSAVRQELSNLKTSLIETEEIAMLQEVGIYHYSTVLESSIGYSEKIKEIEANYSIIGSRKKTELLIYSENMQFAFDLSEKLKIKNIF
jgi:predicted RNase H-like nuclease (RuvC/YqgF family)